MEERSYPSLYQSADRASARSQSNYILAIVVYLCALIISVFLTQFAPPSVVWKIVSAALLLFILFVSIYQAVKRYDVIWYNGRAVAESVKTRTWRFIMRAEPYVDCESIAVVKKVFISDIGEILYENKVIGEHLTDDCSSECITDEMIKIRNLPLSDRKEYYKSNRIDNQRKWYAKKASWNKKQSVIWFGLMVISNSIAIILVLVQIAYPNNKNLPIETFLVLASAVLTWIQVKRFQDLSTSYNLTAHEITIIRQNSDLVNTETDFSDFVKDAENAFSREHTQWVARKDK